MGDGPEKISDREELAAVRHLGRKAFLRAVLSAILATASFALMPLSH